MGVYLFRHLPIERVKRAAPFLGAGGVLFRKAVLTMLFEACTTSIEERS
jgi:hypothetical protein